MTDAVISLDTIATQIRDAWSASKNQQIHAWEGYFTVGRLLRQARDQFQSDILFGQWFAGQEFGFNRQWAHKLRTVADRETDARALLTSALAGSDSVPGVENIIRQLNTPPAPVVTEQTDTAQAEETDLVTLGTTAAFNDAIVLLTALSRINYQRDILPTTSDANLQRLQALATRADRVIHRMLVTFATITVTEDET